MIKKGLFLIALGLGLSAQGCSPSGPPSEVNDLVVDPMVLQLTAGATTPAAAAAELTCGCPFLLKATMLGDTNAIRFNITPALTDTVYNKYRIEALPAQAIATGSYTAKIAFRAPGDAFRSDFHDTLTATLVVP